MIEQHKDKETLILSESGHILGSVRQLRLGVWGWRTKTRDFAYPTRVEALAERKKLIRLSERV